MFERADKNKFQNWITKSVIKEKENKRSVKKSQKHEEFPFNSWAKILSDILSPDENEEYQES